MSEASGRGRHVALFVVLYASEGAPIGFIWWALPTVLRAAGVSIVDITSLTALLVLPWALKFAWAPLVDAVRSRRFGLRGWIVGAQVTMALSLLPLVWLDPVGNLATWRWLLLVHAVSAATQDVAIDALAIGSVPEALRGRLNGAMQAGMLVGRSAFGGGALLVLATVGREWIVVALIAWILVALAFVPWIPEADQAGTTRDRLSGFRRRVAGAGRRAATWWGLVFALVSAAAFEAAGQLAGPFLIDRGVEVETVGVFFGVFVVAATLVGGLIGGAASDRMGHRQACGLFLGGVIASVSALALADHLSASPPTLFALLTTMYLFVGLFTAASYALFMDLTDPALGGTQFSAYMSATNACESWSTWAGGRLTAAGGYPAAFIVMSVVSVAAMPLLRLIGRATRPLRQTPSPES